MHFASTSYNSFAYGLNHGRQPVGADVGVGIDENVLRRAVLGQNVEYFVDRSALFAAGI